MSDASLEQGELPSLASFGAPLDAVVVGASGGLGRAFVEALFDHPSFGRLTALSRRRPTDLPDKVAWAPLDLENEDSIAIAAKTTCEAGRPNLVLVATGLLHDGAALRPEKTWRSLDATTFERVLRINTVGPALAAKHFLPLLPRDRKAVFAAISARVGSIGDNELGGWYAYRASKAALNMLIRTAAIELARSNPTALCVGLHPGTVDTALSQPFQSAVPSGGLFSPSFAAGRLLHVIDRLAPEESGRVFAWDGERISGMTVSDLISHRRVPRVALWLGWAGVLPLRRLGLRWPICGLTPR